MTKRQLKQAPVVNDSSRLNEFGREVVGFDLEIQLGFRPFAVNTPANMNSLTQLSPKQLRQAANIQEKIQDLQKELAVILGGEIPIPFATKEKKGKRRMSAAGRAAIAAAARARWAKIKGEAPKKKRKMSVAWRKALKRAWAARRAKGKAIKKAKRKFSAAGRAALSAAAKARWAKAKAAGKAKL